MNKKFSFCVRFSGITVKFSLPTEVTLPKCFVSLMCEDVENPSVEYEVCLIDTPLCPKSDPIRVEDGSYIYETSEGYLRIYSALIADDGCQVACLLRPNGKNTMYYPKIKWSRFSKYWHCQHLLWGEQLLLFNNAFLLHSSVVEKNGKMVLFSGPSGAGKSTQASLWQKYLNAEIINGDRCVIMQKDDIFYGGGSIWSGTSDIYSPKQAPIAGIVILKKDKENSIRRLTTEAFMPLFSQTTLNSWNPDFMEKISKMYAELLAQVPVYELSCRVDKEAVMLAYNTLFGKENEV